jgi:Zn ribbon nucleic-acid-binding protein
MAEHLECDACGLAACDLPDGVDPELIFERDIHGMFCPACRRT